MLDIEPRVDRLKLQEILEAAHESDSVEYIASCDVATRRDTVELATEVGALAARGGYLVIGVDDSGTLTGRLTEAMSALFDDAIVRDKLARYLPDLNLHVGRHVFEGGLVVLIAVMPHSDGAAVFAADGTFDHAGKPKTVFRKGDIFVRHGSKSERPTQSDLRRLRAEAIQGAQMWAEHLERLADLVGGLAEIIERERTSHPDGRLMRLGVPTQIPTARERLKTTLALVARTNGPHLPVTRRLAETSHYVFASQMLGDIYDASAEIAAAAESRARNA